MKAILLTSLLISLNFGVWAMNALMLNGTILLSAKTMIPVLIQASPERIRLNINNKPWQGKESDNGWIQTPATVFLPEGQHKISVDRPGYVPHIFKLLTATGENPEIKTELESQEEMFIEVEISASDDLLDSFIMIVDSGLAMGPPPLRIDDLTPGKHSLELRWTGLDSFRKKPFRCAFNANIKNGDNQLKINISRSGKKLRIPGCKKL